MLTSRAIRSAQRSRGSVPAAIAASTAAGVRDGDRDRADGGQRVDALGLDTATDRDAGHAGRLRPAGDPEGRLAERGLGVDAALPGDDEVGVREAGIEVGRLHHEVDAGAQGE